MDIIDGKLIYRIIRSIVLWKSIRAMKDSYNVCFFRRIGFMLVAAILARGLIYFINNYNYNNSLIIIINNNNNH